VSRGREWELSIVYRIALSLRSQARRKAQRANGAWIYLIDDNGTRYLPMAASNRARLF
jgi:hypothetical protein